jgi:hypothetical protein
MTRTAIVTRLSSGMLAMLLATVAHAQSVPTNGAAGGTQAKVAASHAPAVLGAPAAQKNATRPLWTELTPEQQQALSPLASEWNQLEAPRKAKWLQIGNKFAKMKPDEQQRVQERMREWVKLTPEQRRIARESYARAKKLNPDQKSAKWEQYQQLSEEQRQKLAADASKKKRITTLPPPSQAKAKTVQPIKTTPKPVLERSVTPQATSQSALQAQSDSPTK